MQIFSLRLISYKICLSCRFAMAICTHSILKFMLYDYTVLQICKEQNRNLKHVNHFNITVSGVISNVFIIHRSIHVELKCEERNKMPVKHHALMGSSGVNKLRSTSKSSEK